MKRQDALVLVVLAVLCAFGAVAGELPDAAAGEMVVVGESVEAAQSPAVETAALGDATRSAFEQPSWMADGSASLNVCEWVLTCSLDKTCLFKCQQNGCTVYYPTCISGRCFCDLR